MNKDTVIKLLMSDKKYLKICRKIAGGNDLYEDLFQESILILLEYPEAFFSTLKCAECFFLKIVDRSWNSVTSRFYYKYRKDAAERMMKEQPEESYDIEADMNFESTVSNIKQQLDSQYWYDRAIWEMYQSEGSSRKVSKKTGIPFRNIARTVKKVKTNIYENITGSKP